MSKKALPFIRFNRISDVYKKNVANCTFDGLQESAETNVDEFFISVIKDFSGFSTDTLIKCPTKTLKNVLNIIENAFTQETFEKMVKSWPPVAVVSKPTSKIAFFFIAKIAYEIDDQIKLFKWVSYSFRPFKNNPKHEIVAFINGADTSGQSVLALIYRNKNLVYFSGENKKETKISQISISIEDKTISFKNESETVLTLKPSNASELTSWVDILDDVDEGKENALEHYFLVLGKGPYPKEFQNLFVSMITSVNDQKMLRSLLMLVDEKQKDAKQILESLYDIFTKENKVNILYSTLVITDIERSNGAINSLAENGSLTMQMLTILVKKFIIDYQNEFFTKFFDYLEEKGDLGLRKEGTDIKDAKTFFFSAMKYFLGSGFFMAPEITHFLSFVRTYLPIVVNDRISVFNVLASLFYNCIFYPAVNGVDPFPPPKVTNKEQLKEIAEYFHRILIHQSLNDVNPKLADWENRILFKVHPKVDTFLAYISENLEDIEYKLPEEDKLSSSIQNCIDMIRNNGEEFNKTFDSLANDKIPYGTTCGWNMAVLVSFMFPNACDKEELDLNKENKKEEFRNMLDSNAYRISEVPASPCGEPHKEKRIVLSSPSKYIVPMSLMSKIPIFEDNKLPKLPPLPVIGSNPFSWKPVLDEDKQKKSSKKAKGASDDAQTGNKKSGKQKKGKTRPSQKTSDALETTDDAPKKKTLKKKGGSRKRSKTLDENQKKKAKGKSTRAKSKSNPIAKDGEAKSMDVSSKPKSKSKGKKG